MRRQLSFLETTQPNGTAPVWAVLDDEQRAKVVAMLARLIAKMATAREEAARTITKGQEDE